ncbi:hypothetical protein CYY_007227 [Polysphondylium violaceum]|uniref:Trimethylguanosine synthase n=1 Tax=Polysphondylium violaceum TaxID=133409 RepID=A0A8J4PPZ7_9MYCE|nr:hypothetical protein CYY_007227 [Polysphondylium violaceum]
MEEYFKKRIDILEKKTNDKSFDTLPKAARKRQRKKLRSLVIQRNQWLKKTSAAAHSNDSTNNFSNESQKNISTNISSSTTGKRQLKGKVVKSQTTATRKKVDESTDESESDEDEEEQEEEEEKEKEENGFIGFLPQTKENQKYYYQRYRLFSKFDEGIILDEESWYSVTPEKIANHIAERLRSNIVFDAFGGAGGNTIALANTCNIVIHNDIDPIKTHMAKHNSLVYSHTQENTNIEFINCDFMAFSESYFGTRSTLPPIPLDHHCDCIFLSPPWGGPEYLQKEHFYIGTMPIDGFDIFRQALKISPNVAYFLPRNTHIDDIRKLSKIYKDLGYYPYDCEVEENYLNESIKSITIYFGNLINRAESS